MEFTLICVKLACSSISILGASASTQSRPKCAEPGPLRRLLNCQNIGLREVLCSGGLGGSTRKRCQRLSSYLPGASPRYGAARSRKGSNSSRLKGHPEPGIHERGSKSQGSNGAHLPVHTWELPPRMRVRKIS